MHVIGGTRTGKSKFLEWMIRQDLMNGQGLCLIDWHGTLYHDVLQFCAHLGIGLEGDRRSVILLNPSAPDFITGFNPFINPGPDISTSVNQWIDAIVRPFGDMNTNQMPTLERTLRVVLHVGAEQGETIINMAHLTEPDQRQLRDYAIATVKDSYIRSQLKRFQRIKREQDWESKVLSTENRFSRFIGSLGVRRFMGLKEGNIDLLDIMDNQKILLVNLGDSGFLDRTAARLFASNLLYEFKRIAMQRADRAKGSREKPALFLLYLDEFQEYITEDITAILDQTLKGGLHMILAHQHRGHLADHPALEKSIATNARIKAVFGGLDFEDTAYFANEMFLPDLNTRKIKKAYYHTIHLYKKIYETTRSFGTIESTTVASGHSRGTGTMSGSGHVNGRGMTSQAGQSFGGPVEGWSDPGEVFQYQSNSEGFSEFSSESSFDASSDFEGESESTAQTTGRTQSTTVYPVWEPIPTQELGSEAEWSLEEKRSKIAEMLMCQMQQHCFIKLDRAPTQPMWVPTVKDPGYSAGYMLNYQNKVYDQQKALPAPEVDRLIEESEQRFLAKVEPVKKGSEAKTLQELDEEDIIE